MRSAVLRLHHCSSKQAAAAVAADCLGSLWRLKTAASKFQSLALCSSCLKTVILSSTAMAGILISPRVEQKILGKRAAWKLKNGNPKFKDILRQRCRLRLKERRELFVAQARGFGYIDQVEKSLAHIVQEEYKKFIETLEMDFVPNQWDDEELTVLSGEYFSEEEEQLLNHFDYLFQDDALEKLLEEADSVVCPLCLKARLYEVAAENILRCQNCVIQVSGCSKLSEIRLHISRCLDAHSLSGCPSNVNFFVNSEEGVPHLYSLCSDCSFFDIVG